MSISTIKLHRSTRRRMEALDELWETTLGGELYPDWDFGFRKTKVDYKKPETVCKHLDHMVFKTTIDMSLRIQTRRINQEESKRTRDQHQENMIALLRIRNAEGW